MPQFDLTFYWSQLFWMLICFGILFWAMHFWIVPFFSAIRVQRKKELDDLIKKTRNLQKKAEILAKDDRDILEKTREEARKIIEEATLTSQEYYRKHLQNLDELFNQVLEKTKKNLLQEKKQALKNVEKLSFSLTKSFIQSQFPNFETKMAKQKTSSEKTKKTEPSSPPKKRSSSVRKTIKTPSSNPDSKP